MSFIRRSIRAARAGPCSKGSHRAGARAMLRAFGLTDEDFKKPQIGVGATWNKVTPCNAGLDTLRDAAAKRLNEQRRRGLRVRHHFSVRWHLHGQQRHARLARLARLDRRLRRARHARALLRRAARHRRLRQIHSGHAARHRASRSCPPCSPTAARSRQGACPIEDISLQDVYEAIGAREQGLISSEQLTAVEKAACPGIGTCAGMFSANTMASVAEALGLTVPGMAAPPAAAADRVRVLESAADALLHAVKAGIRPSDILDPQVFRERHGGRRRRSAARRMHVCTSWRSPRRRASISHWRTSMPSAAARPQLADMKPAGRYMMRELHLAGGVPAVMRELLSAGLLHGDAKTITGRTHRASRSRPFPPGSRIRCCARRRIRSRSAAATPWYAARWRRMARSPKSPTKLACITKVLRAASTPSRKARRPCARAEIQKGDVVVLRFEGPVGGPGMPEMTALTGAIVGAGLGGEVARRDRWPLRRRHQRVVHRPCRSRSGAGRTDRAGARWRCDRDRHRERDASSCTSRRRSSNRRRAVFSPPAPRHTDGVLAKYAKLVTSAAKGARCVP